MTPCVDCLRLKKKLADKNDYIRRLEASVMEAEARCHQKSRRGIWRRMGHLLPIFRFLCKLGTHPCSDVALIDGQYYNVCPFCETKWGPW